MTTLKKNIYLRRSHRNETRCKSFTKSRRHLLLSRCCSSLLYRYQVVVSNSPAPRKARGSALQIELVRTQASTACRYCCSISECQQICGAAWRMPRLKSRTRCRRPSSMYAHERMTNAFDDSGDMRRILAPARCRPLATNVKVVSATGRLAASSKWSGGTDAVPEHNHAGIVAFLNSFFQVLHMTQVRARQRE